MQSCSRHSDGTAVTDRAGVAPLEFVLAMPLFVLLVLFLYLVAGAITHRMQAIETTRFKTWSALPPTVADRPMVMERPIIDGAQEDNTTIPYKFGGQLSVHADARSGTGTLAGTWDHRTVPFELQADQYQAHDLPAQQISDVLGRFGGIRSFLRRISQNMTQMQRQVGVLR